MFHSRYDHLTEEKPKGHQRVMYWITHSKFVRLFVYAFDLFVDLSTTGSNQAYRAISTGQLNALLHLHLRPIDVVVFHGPQGYLVLRGASRLDAFSGYPVRT